MDHENIHAYSLGYVNCIVMWGFTWGWTSNFFCRYGLWESGRHRVIKSGHHLTPIFTNLSYPLLLSHAWIVHMASLQECNSPKTLRACGHVRYQYFPYFHYTWPKNVCVKKSSPCKTLAHNLYESCTLSNTNALWTFSTFFKKLFIPLASKLFFMWLA